MHDAGVSVEKYNPHRFLLGVMMGRQPIVRDPKNYKYYIPYDMVARTGEPGKEFFPEYISGNLRISNPGTARAIAEAARVVRFLWLEDVWLTGYIAQYLHIEHLVGDSSFPSSVTKSMLQPCGQFWTQHEDELFIQKGLQNPSVYFKDFIREGINSKHVDITITCIIL